MAKFDRHVFVCQTARPPAGRPSCLTRGGADVLAALEKALSERPELWGRVGITACECLGPCFEGPNMVVYPEGVWYSDVSTTDVPEIIEHLAGGAVVDRLVYDWPSDDD